MCINVFSYFYLHKISTDKKELEKIEKEYARIEEYEKAGVIHKLILNEKL
jgi:hypothetical protein